MVWHSRTNHVFKTNLVNPLNMGIKNSIFIVYQEIYRALSAVRNSSRKPAPNIVCCFTLTASTSECLSFTIQLCFAALLEEVRSLQFPNVFQLRRLNHAAINAVITLARLQSLPDCSGCQAHFEGLARVSLLIMFRT